MARRRYYRRYIRVAPKKKWASNIIQGSVTNNNFGVICENSAQNSTPTPVIVKCGNFKVQGDVMFSSQASTSRPVNMNFFLLFVPEGVTPSDALIGAHPEWVMAWKNLDVGIVNASSSTGSQTTNFSVSSRLKRNLNSGDRVVALLQTNETHMDAVCVFTTQFWTCAN